MKLANLIKLSVFSKESENDNEEVIKEKLLSLIPFDLEKEKLKLEQDSAEGLEGKRIRIFSIKLQKQRHTNQFLENLKEKLTKEQKELLLRQIETRLENELNFFIRLDKNKLINNSEFFITEKGNCFHIKISIAAFPAKREKALEVVKQIFG